MKKISHGISEVIPVAPDQSQTLSCPLAPGIERLREHCLMAGHWRVRRHWLARRVTADAVLIYCVAGGGHFTMDGQTRRIAPGDLFLCPPRIEHGYGCDYPAGWEIWWTHFQGTHADALCRAAGLDPSRPLLRPGIRPELIRCFTELHQSLTVRTPQIAWEAAACLHRLLLELVRLTGGGAASPARSLAEQVDGGGADVGELARRAGYSKYHFCRLFKQETGVSPWQYATIRKLERAKELLLGTRRSIKEIAAELGFEHPDYFARLFARHIGVTPKQFRGTLVGPHGETD